MTCLSCRIECKRHGRDRKGNQRFKCQQCSKTFLEPRTDHLDGMYLPIEKAEMVLRLLLEGNSVSSVERTTDVHHTTILKLLALAGEKCGRIMADKIRNVEVRDVEADEVWGFIGKKQKRVRPEDDQNVGDCYTFVAIERHSKLVLNIAMGKRDQQTTNIFVEGIRQALPANVSKSRRTDSRHIVTRSLTPWGTVAILPCSSRSTALRAKAKRGTRPPKSNPWR
jgi:transposase-like protein